MRRQQEEEDGQESRGGAGAGGGARHRALCHRPPATAPHAAGAAARTSSRNGRMGWVRESGFPCWVQLWGWIHPPTTQPAGGTVWWWGGEGWLVWAPPTPERFGVWAWPRWAGRRRRARWPPLLPCRWDVGVSLTRSVSHRITRQWQRRRGTASCPLRTPTGSRNGLAIRGRSLTNEWLPASSTHAAYVRIYVCVRISSWSSYSSCAPAPINVHTSGRVKHGAQQDSLLCCRPLMRGEMGSLLLSRCLSPATGWYGSFAGS
jgi:hypothetical protein